MADMKQAQKIRFAVTPPASALGEGAFDAYLERCEALGFDTLWLSDIPLGAQGDPLLHLTYAAARTRRLKLGANIVPLGRNPLWLAKQLAQLDRLSNGRLLLSFVPGLGTAPERLALGYERGDRGLELERILAMLRRWWGGEAVTAECQGARFEALTLEPRPLQQPLEVWLGGKGPVALERVARAADGWLTSVVKPEEARLARQAIERRAAELGRHIDPEHFGISIPGGAPRAARGGGRCAARAARGPGPDRHRGGRHPQVARPHRRSPGRGPEQVRAAAVDGPRPREPTGAPTWIGWRRRCSTSSVEAGHERSLRKS
jgi:hypothetical protein